MPFSYVQAQKFIGGGQHFTMLISGIVSNYHISYLIDVLLDVLGHGSCDNRYALPDGGVKSDSQLNSGSDLVCFLKK